MLDDDPWYVRDADVDALGEIGPEAKSAVPALTKMLGDKDRATRRAAIGVLGKIGLAAGTAAPSACPSCRRIAMTSSLTRHLRH